MVLCKISPELEVGMIIMAVDMVGIVVGTMVVCGFEVTDDGKVAEECKNVLSCGSFGVFP